MPTPRPDIDVTLSAVERPGVKMVFNRARGDIVCHSPAVVTLAAMARMPNLSTLIPRPSSAISMMI
jgi:hypothetical protein